MQVFSNEALSTCGVHWFLADVINFSIRIYSHAYVRHQLTLNSFDGYLKRDRKCAP